MLFQRPPHEYLMNMAFFLNCVSLSAIFKIYSCFYHFRLKFHFIFTFDKKHLLISIYDQLYLFTVPDLLSFFLSKLENSHSCILSHCHIVILSSFLSSHTALNIHLLFQYKKFYQFTIVIYETQKIFFSCSSMWSI